MYTLSWRAASCRGGTGTAKTQMPGAAATLVLCAVVSLTAGLRLPASSARRSSELQASATLEATASKAAVLAACESAPPNGVDASDEQVAAVEAAIKELEPFCPPQPAQIPLSGVYDLVFCTAKGGSNGKVGPFVGKVTQTFVDETNFINAVALFGGAVKISLFAEREVLDDDKIRVTFKETAGACFGKQLFRKEIQGSGVWKQRFVDDELRVMNTPSIFVLRKRPEEP